MADFKRFRDHIIANERDVEFPYLDSKGLITIGPGLNIQGRTRQQTEANFKRLNLEITDRETGQQRPATEAEKMEALNALRAEQQRGPGSRGSGAYRETTQVTLPEAERDHLLDQQIDTRIGKIKGEVGAANWDKLTDGQKTAVLDIHYANGSLDKFTNLKQAIKDGNAEAMAAEAGFRSGRNEDGTPIRNWEREARNQAAILGVSQEEGRRAVLDKYQGKENPRFPGQIIAPPKGTEASSAAKDPMSTDNLIERLKANPLPRFDGQPAPWPTASQWPQTSDGGSPKDTNIGGLANEAAETAKATEAPEQTANTDSRIASLRERAAAPIDHPARSALLKPVDRWTESEMKDVLNAAQGDFTGWKSGDPQKAHMVEKVQDWHTAIYGDGEQRYDGGKPVEPQPITAIPETPAPHTTPDGADLWQASARMGDKIATAAETDGYGTTVKGLQRGINILNSTLPLPERSPAWGDYTKQVPLKEDGDYGPKTDFALKSVLANHGSAKADDALALGRFNIFAEDAKAKGSGHGLDQATQSIFGPLYNQADAPNGVLQSTLNKVGASSIDGWKPLKEDGWIGPKTTDAFAQVMDETDPQDFTRSFGQGLGFL